MQNPAPSKIELDFDVALSMISIKILKDRVESLSVSKITVPRISACEKLLEAILLLEEDVNELKQLRLLCENITPSEPLL